MGQRLHNAFGHEREPGVFEGGVCYVALLTQHTHLHAAAAAAAADTALSRLAAAANMLLRIDDIVSGISKRQAGGGGPSGPQVDDHENVDTEQMLPE